MRDECCSCSCGSSPNVPPRPTRPSPSLILQVAAVILRIDSPGGDALASDLMWREIQQLAAKKPVIASMVDVAASGGET